jgi:FeS assembly SUF system protein
MNSINVSFKQNIPGAVDTAVIPADASLQGKIVAVIKQIYDPELPVNIYDLGLIYKIVVNDKDVSVLMTLTTPNCPVAGSMPARVECAIRELDEVEDVSVELTWDPPWNSENLSDEVKLTLGLL